MNATVAQLTARTVLGRRRTLLLLLLPLVLLALCIFARVLAAYDQDVAADLSQGLSAQLLGAFGLGVLLPLLGLIAGTGTLTGIGPVQLSSTDCINPLTANSFTFTSDDVVLTTANGDQIWATYSGVLGADGTLSGTYMFVGGTGRFATASGSGIALRSPEISAMIVRRRSRTRFWAVRSRS